MQGRSRASFGGVSAFNQAMADMLAADKNFEAEYFGSKVVKYWMSTKKTVMLWLVLWVGTFAITQAVPTEAELINQAKVKKSEAQRIALERAPQGRVKSAEIEKERGKLVWSFDISTPGTRDITEVLVDANTGGMVSIAKETPKQQAAEAKADKRKQ